MTETIVAAWLEDRAELERQRAADDARDARRYRRIRATVIEDNTQAQHSGIHAYEGFWNTFDVTDADQFDAGIDAMSAQGDA